MASEFDVEILTPSKEVVRATASEVLLPSIDGEVGILPGHEDLIGLLSTGTLKIVRNSKDYWFMVSGGSFVVEGGNVTLLAEYGTTADEVDVEAADARLAEVEEELKKLSDTREHNYQQLSLEQARLTASKEASRRHTMS